VVTTVAHCTDTSEQVVVHPLPQPGITQDGNTLSTEDHYASYQWYYGTQSITGANQPNYTYAAAGDYRVEVIDTNGCAGMSQPFTSVGIQRIVSDHGIRVYPNPAQPMIHVTASILMFVTISSLDGREVIHTAHTSRIDISGLAEGLYMLQVQDEAGAVVHIEKLVKLAR